MDESHKEPNVVPTAKPKDWPNNLEMGVEYISGFSGADGHPINYCLRYDLVLMSELTNPTVGANNSTYLIWYEEMMACGKITSGTIAAETYPEVVGPFSDSYIADRYVVLYMLVDILQNTDA